jgi:hypothetical protein
MKHGRLIDVLTQSPPAHFVILDELLGIFSSQTYLHSAYIRGSVASNSYDRSSDVDLVLVITDDSYILTVDSLDAIIQQHFCIIRPGWLDKIVPNFGGLGYVYLVSFENKIYQLDLYLLPLSQADSIHRMPKATLVFSQDARSASLINQKMTLEVTQYIEDKKQSPESILALSDEIIVLSFLIKKRIKRQQLFLNASETYMLAICLRKLMRLTWEPHLLDFGWYHFLEWIKFPDEILQLKLALLNLLQKHSISTNDSLCMAHDLLFKILRCNSLAEDHLKSIKQTSDIVLRGEHD